MSVSMEQLYHINNNYLIATAVITIISAIATFILFHGSISGLLSRLVTISFFIILLQYLIVQYNFGDYMYAVLIMTIIFEIIIWIWYLSTYYFMSKLLKIT